MLANYIAASLAMTDGAWDPGLGARMAQIRCPVLASGGARSDFLPIRHAQLQATTIPRGELWVEHKVGHYWPMTEEGSEVFIGRVLNWLGSRAAAGIRLITRSGRYRVRDFR